jgi:hypothetical protein
LERYLTILKFFMDRHDGQTSPQVGQGGLPEGSGAALTQGRRCDRFLEDRRPSGDATRRHDGKEPRGSVCQSGNSNCPDACTLVLSSAEADGFARTTRD